jgi:hypothetical protein
VERYFQTSEIWHKFLAIAGENAIAAGSDVDRSLQDATPSAWSVSGQKGDRSATEIIAPTGGPSQGRIDLKVGGSVARGDNDYGSASAAKRGA